MNNKDHFPAGMKGVLSGAAGGSRGFRWKLPALWGIDLVMCAVMICLTVLTAVNRDAILVVAARVIIHLVVAATVLLVLAVTIAVVMGIRNKRMW